jgi:hypothetical protein
MLYSLLSSYKKTFSIAEREYIFMRIILKYEALILAMV